MYVNTVAGQHARNDVPADKVRVMLQETPHADGVEAREWVVGDLPADHPALAALQAAYDQLQAALL